MKRILAIVLLLIGGAAALWLPGFYRAAGVGAGFVAKQMCSCVFVGDRSDASCRPDLLESMDSIEAERLDGVEGFRAFIPLLAERRALHEPPYGCILQP